MVWLNRCMKAMILAVSSGTSLYGEPAMADKIPNRVAVFSFLDKEQLVYRARHSVEYHRSIRFAQGYTARTVYAGRRPRSQRQRRSSKSTIRSSMERRSASSPAGCSPKSRSHAVEHPVYDVWLTDCQKPAAVAAPVAAATPADWHRAGGPRRRARRQAPGQAPIARPSIRSSPVRGLTPLGLTPYIRQPYTAGRSSSVG